VFPQVIGLCKPLSTDLTGEWPFPRVSTHMLLQIASLGERPITHHAREPSLASVDQHVAPHGRLQSERLGTHGTLVWTFSGMSAFVIPQLVQTRITPSTIFALKWPLTCININNFQILLE